MSLKDLPAEMRPREKLLARGGGALHRTARAAAAHRPAGQGVFELSAHALREFQSFAGLLQAEAADLKRIKGLGPAKRAEIAAVVEMARRALAQPLRAAPVFDAPQKVKDYLALQLGARAQEVFVVRFLDGQHRLLQLEEIFHGSLAQTSVYPREVVRRALELNAGAVILAHSHPSGVAEPSRADEVLTQTLKYVLQMVDVRVLDHLVVGQGSVISLAERGLL